MRLIADKEVRHGLHTDYFWPGRIHSRWDLGRFGLRRERQYQDPDNTRLVRTSWQFGYNDERWDARRWAIRFEGKHLERI